jgi:hypothetical protein
LNGIVAELADIFTEDLEMTPSEMIILETFLLDCIDLIFGRSEEWILELEDALVDLHNLKRAYLDKKGPESFGGVLEFWGVMLFPGPELP